MKKKAAGLITLVILFFLVAPACQKSEEPRPRTVVEPKWGLSSRGAQPQSVESLEKAFIKIAGGVAPAVANISTVRPGAQKEEGGFPFRSAPRLKEFFEDLFKRNPSRQPAFSLGSGIVIDKSGYILTNYHVVREAREIIVKLDGRAQYRGRLIGMDPVGDLAVIKIDPGGPLPTAPLGDSESLKIGQWAIAIGNPFGLDRTVTIGVISGLGRSRIRLGSHQEFIQTDASINPGNSGGPLLNLAGQVVGVNTAILAWGHGIGFAIPISIAKKVALEIMENGRVSRPWMGVGIENLGQERASSLGLSDVEGVLISRVFSKSPAQRAGVLPGDIITKFNGQEIQAVDHLQRLVVQAKVGHLVELGLLRKGRLLQVKIQLVERPPDPEAEAAMAPEEKTDRLGIAVQDLPEDISKETKGGVVVWTVAAGSQGSRAGLLVGDIILSVNRVPIKGVEQYHKVMAKVKPGEEVAFRLHRNDTRVDLAFLTAK